MPSKATDEGWATRSLDDSMQQAEARGLGLWQLIMIFAAFSSAVSVPRWILVVVHLAVFALAWLIVSRTWRAWPLLVAICAATALDYRAAVDANGVLCFVAVWTTILTTAIPFLLMRAARAWAPALLAVAAAGWAMLSFHPGWGPGLPATTAATSIALMIAALGLMVPLRRFAAATDEQEAATSREHERLAISRTVARAAAEDARVMHDTVINTLGAVAAGGRAMLDGGFVREQCARDVAAVQVLLGGFKGPGRGPWPATGPVPPGMTVRRSGLAGPELERHLRRLAPPTARAVGGAVDELVRNAVKHSGADRVGIDVRCDGEGLTVTVADEGRGFDGETIPGRGLAESVVGRGGDAGFHVTIDSAHGEGTSVRLSVPLIGDEPGAPESDGSPSDVARIVGGIKGTACWTWAVVLIGFGLLSALINQPEDALATYAMLAIVSALSLTTWLACRGGSPIPAWLMCLVLAGIPAAFIAGLAGFGFGRGDHRNWPAIALTPLLVLLLVTARSRRPFYVGAGLLVASAAAGSYLVWRAAPAAVAIVPAGAASQLGVVAAWLVFYQVIDGIGAGRRRIQQDLAASRADRTAQDAVAAGRARLTATGARSALRLLRGIASGEADPADPRIWAECAAAERHLRQLLLLNPENVHMSPWFGRALEDARSRSVSLTVRACPEDAPDERLAESLGRLILASVDAVPTGAELSVGVFPSHTGPRLFMVGPGGSLGEVQAPAGLSDGSTFTRERFGAQDLIELALIGPAAAGTDERVSPAGIQSS